MADHHRAGVAGLPDRVQYETGEAGFVLVQRPVFRVSRCEISFRPTSFRDPPDHEYGQIRGRGRNRSDGILK